MAYSASRLTLYALLSAIEDDLRDLILAHVVPNHDVVELLGQSLHQRCVERYAKDSDQQAMAPSTVSPGQLLTYIDFPDAYQILARFKGEIPPEFARQLAARHANFENLIPIRNRVAHSRPLNYDDLAVTVDLSESISKEHPNFWRACTDTLRRLQEEPSFVLGLRIRNTDPLQEEVSHNLPIPDFDETGFLGRRKTVDDLIRLCYGPYPVITIVGEGGLGKTALALKAAYEVLDRDDCPFEAVVWTSAKTSQITAQEIVNIEGAISDSLGMLIDVAKELGGNSADDPMKEILGYLEQFKILLILDNLETVIDDRIRELLRLLPTGSKVLITSRIGLGAFEYPVKLSALDENDAVMLLRALARGRGVNDLARMPQNQLGVYSKRMKYNPGFIKWFVSAVQAGARPEEVLAHPEKFLEFCMDNVYRYLSAESRAVLRSMVSLPGKHSQAELAFVNEMEAIDLQRAIQQLLTTNMVLMSSVPSGSSFESQYDLAQLARDYLARKHPVEPEAFRGFARKRQQMVAAGEAMEAERRSNPYSFLSIAMRSKSDLIVAKYLRDALVSGKRRDFLRSDELILKAKKLAPEYFEVHRVEAFLQVQQRNNPGAQLAYEAAISLEPKSAPLRLWYGGFLMRYHDDVQAAIIQLEEAEKLDPHAADVEIEMARAYLYSKQYSKAKEKIESQLARATLDMWRTRKVHDLHLQLYRRWAEDHVQHHDEVSALQCLESFAIAYDSVPKMAKDEDMRKQVDKARFTLGTIRPNREASLRQRIDQLYRWFGGDDGNVSQGHRPGPVRTEGKIARRPDDKDFAFIESDGGLDFFVHRSAFGSQAAWKAARMGTRFSFIASLNQGRRVALDPRAL